MERPVRKAPLTIASEMIAEFGDKAELLAGDRMDAALQADDRESYEEWRLVAKTIALLTRHNPEPVPAKTKPKAAKTASEEPGLLKWMRK
jgi:hypothetical protein